MERVTTIMRKAKRMHEFDSRDLDGKTLQMTYYCEKDVCFLVGLDEHNNVYIYIYNSRRDESEGARF